MLVWGRGVWGVGGKVLVVRACLSYAGIGTRRNGLDASGIPKHPTTRRLGSLHLDASRLDASRIPQNPTTRRSTKGDEHASSKHRNRWSTSKSIRRARVQQTPQSEASPFVPFRNPKLFGLHPANTFQVASSEHVSVCGLHLQF